MTLRGCQTPNTPDGAIKQFPRTSQPGCSSRGVTSSSWARKAILSPGACPRKRYQDPQQTQFLLPDGNRTLTLPSPLFGAGVVSSAAVASKRSFRGARMRGTLFHPSYSTFEAIAALRVPVLAEDAAS